MVMGELMKFHKMTRKDQMRKSLELMFNNSLSDGLSVVAGTSAAVFGERAALERSPASP